ncbi:MAG: hypothetical protein ACJ8R9_17915 [Steroidobacteraceae bacterium]
MYKPPPAPEGWDKTIADLSAELDAGLRTSLGSPEIDWARDYERSLLPPDTRFPHEGDVYEAIEDFEVAYLTSFAAPYTGGGTAILPQGERVVVRYAEPGSRPISVYANALNYKDVEARIVPEADRKARTYDGYYFAIDTADLNTKFRLVSTQGGGPVIPPP